MKTNPKAVIPGSRKNYPHYIFNFIMCITLLASLTSSAQNFTRLYKQTTDNFVYTDAVVMEKFRPSGAYPFSGSVIFQPVEHSGTNEMQLHLVREDGTKIFSKRYAIDVSNGFLNTDFIPTAASYNEVEKLYCVAGVFQPGTTLWNDYTTWVGILDEDLNPILWQLMEIQTLSLSAPPYNSTFVTDICPIYDAPGLNFAFTGLLMISGDNASPIYQGTTPPVNKRIFISCMESSTYFFTTITEYDFQINSNPVEKEYFPSRIIEIPNTQSSGGFLVGGNTQYSNPSDIRQLSMFYLRTDYALNPVDQIARQIDATDEVASAFIGDLKFDPNTDEVYVAGSLHSFEDATHSFFADKLINVTNSSTLNLYSDNWNGTMQIGAFDLPGNPLFGWTKVGRIGEINNGTNVVTGAIYENGIYTNTNKLPCMFEIRYDDPSLINFQTGMQNSSINYYPRVFGSNAPVQYFQSIDYTSQWYPNHCSHPMDVVTGEYFHGGLGVYPSNGLEHLAVLKTDNTYDNSCLHLFIDAQPRFYTTMDANLGVNFTSGLNIQQSTVIVVDNSIAAVDEYFCELTPLKPQVEEIIAYHSENGIRIQELDVESEYSIFSMTGSRIDEGKVYPNETISLNHLPKGVYLLKIKNQFLKIQN